MSQPPEHWSVRVFEALLAVQPKIPFTFARRSNTEDEVVTQVLLYMRVGISNDFNVNLFKRFSADHFYCYVCGLHLKSVLNHKGAIIEFPDTRGHLALHRKQVRAAIDPHINKYNPPETWEHTDEADLAEQSTHPATEKLHRDVPSRRRTG